MVQEYSASEGLYNLLFALRDGGDPGTGISPIVVMAHNLLGRNFPPAIISYAIGQQNNIFGSYPTSTDIAPSIVFAVVFLLLAIGHIIVFSINVSRGHYFWLTPLWIFYCAMRILGWTMRAAWGANILKVSVGLAGEVFLIIPTILLVSINLILAQRLFTWRHPVGGSRRLFWNFMISVYSLVAVVIVITILASFVPYLYFLKTSSYVQWQAVVKASAILIILYSLTAVSLIALSYFFKPTRKDENLYTYQPWWIESFHPFYYVKKGAAREAEETFMKRNHNHRHAVRVIAATHHHYNVVEGLSNQRGTLEHNVSLMIILVTTLFIFVGSIGRCIAVFAARPHYEQNRICNPIVAYIFWGALEAIINVLYLAGRVDLRFYRPDILPAKVRSIITAEQSYYPSDLEDEEEEEYSTFESEDALSSSSQDDLEKQQHPGPATRPSKLYRPPPPDFTLTKPPAAHGFDYNSPSPPYPSSKNHKEDKYESSEEDDFHF